MEVSKYLLPKLGSWDNLSTLPLYAWIIKNCKKWWRSPLSSGGDPFVLGSLLYAYSGGHGREITNLLSQVLDTHVVAPF